MYEGAGTKAELMAFLEGEGFLLQGCKVNTPGRSKEENCIFLNRRAAAWDHRAQGQPPRATAAAKRRSRRRTKRRRI